MSRVTQPTPITAHTAGRGVIFIAKMMTKKYGSISSAPQKAVRLSLFLSQSESIFVFAQESTHLDNCDTLYCSFGVGCCQFLMLLIKHLMLQLPSTTQTRNMSANQTIILLGMLTKMSLTETYQNQNISYNRNILLMSC